MEAGSCSWPSWDKKATASNNAEDRASGDTAGKKLHTEMNASEASDGQTPHGGQPSNTERTRQLNLLADLFISCMQADPRSEKQLKLGAEFNRRLNEYLDQYETESIGTFAYRIAEMGIPYAEVFQDVMYVRGLQAPPAG